MVMQTETKKRNCGNNRDLLSFRKKLRRLDLRKEEWIQDYSMRILRLWQQKWGSPFRVARVYAEQIKAEIAQFYDDPLKRVFIERTYRGNHEQNHNHVQEGNTGPPFSDKEVRADGVIAGQPGRAENAGLIHQTSVLKNCESLRKVSEGS